MNYKIILSGFFLFLMCWAMPGPVSAQKEETKEIVRIGVDLLTGYSGNTVRVYMSYGYQITPQFSAGIGTGFVPYRDPVNLVPVFLDLVYHLREGGTTPYFQLKTGYSISVLKNHNIEPDRHRGGFILNPGVGMQVRPEDEQGFYLTAGFNLDHSVLEQNMSGNRVMKESISWRRISLGFGFIFP